MSIHHIHKGKMKNAGQAPYALHACYLLAMEYMHACTAKYHNANEIPYLFAIQGKVCFNTSHIYIYSSDLLQVVLIMYSNIIVTILL